MKEKLTSLLQEWVEKINNAQISIETSQLEEDMYIGYTYQYCYNELNNIINNEENIIEENINLLIFNWKKLSEDRLNDAEKDEEFKNLLLVKAEIYNKCAIELENIINKYLKE